ncbi:MAG: hypothetical protein Q8N56_00320 [bacterium]|nr:hypothetical protein [bacterium]
MNQKNVINHALADIFNGISTLNNTFPNKEFTIDGRLVGDLGEVIASLNYDIELFPVSQPKHDGKCSDGRLVQVKATFKNSLTFGTIPDYYLGLKLCSDGKFKEIYNGPGKPIYDRYKHRQGVGKSLLSFPIIELKKLSEQVSPSDRIPKRRE